MKKRIIKYALMSMLFLLSIIGIQEVKAEKYTGQAIWPSETIPGIYIKKVKPDGYTKNQQGRFIRRSEDNKFVYCLQPYADIDNNLPYYDVIRDDYASVLNLSEDTWTRINLIAYYGYTYNENGYDHSDHSWYTISQVMIWRLTNPESDIYFTDSLNGNRINSYDDEIAEINSLVDSHFTRPNFNSSDLIVPMGQSVTLSDTNGVLKYFRVTSSENVNATINGNNLTVTATGIGNAKINFIKNAISYELPPIVYFSDHSQNVFRVGHYDPLPANFSLKVVGGRVEITKVDNETMTTTPQGNATLINAEYGVYNTNNELLFKLNTNNNAYAISEYLPSLGEFYVKEIKPSNGYTLDKNKYSFIVDENNLLASIKVYERVIKKDITLFKVFASSETGILKAEANITFDIYLKSNNTYYKSITTDKNGYASLTLPYGIWTFKQKNTTPDYEKADEFDINVNENSDDNIYKLISNAPIEAKLKVVKIDKETKEVITKAGIKFKIKDLSTNEYVCQTITYPTATKVCIYETDNNGVIITPSTLVGNFQLEEVENQIVDGYTWNSNSIQFHIGEGSEIFIDPEYGSLLAIDFSNKRVKGKVEINKIGEKVVIENNSYTYFKDKLNGVKIGLYADEDIYVGKTLIYSKGDLIETLITDKGYAISKELELGKYYLKEMETNTNHVLDDKKYSFELLFNDQYTSLIQKTIDLENRYKKGTLNFTKTDIATSKGIPNTLIEIYTENDELVFSGKTDSNGDIKIDNLFVGKFYIIEKEAATGYVITNEKVLFEIKENGETIKSTMANEKIKGSLKITKVDSIDLKTIPNTTIGIYNDKDELLFTEITNEDGQIIINDLEYGKYYIREITPADGYELNDGKIEFEIKENKEIIEITMSNDLIVEVPNTENKESLIIPIISITAMILGLGVVIYANKKRKK